MFCLYNESQRGLILLEHLVFLTISHFFVPQIKKTIIIGLEGLEGKLLNFHFWVNFDEWFCTNKLDDLSISLRYFQRKPDHSTHQQSSLE